MHLLLQEVFPGEEKDSENAVTWWASWGNQQGNQEPEHERVWTKNKVWAKCLQICQNQAAPQDFSQAQIQFGKSSFQCILILLLLLLLFFFIFRWGFLFKLDSDTFCVTVIKFSIQLFSVNTLKSFLLLKLHVCGLNSHALFLFTSFHLIDKKHWKFLFQINWRQFLK